MNAGSKTIIQQNSHSLLAFEDIKMHPSLYIFMLTLAVSFGAEKPKLPCALKWVGMSRGDVVPENAVLAYKPATYVSRGQTQSGKPNRLGHYDAELDQAFAPTDTDSVQTLQSFEILLNEFGCLLNWVAPTHPDVLNAVYRVPSGDGNPSNYIGRAAPSTDEDLGWESETSELVSGSVDPVAGIIRIVNGNVTEDLPDYYVLLSQSTGLKLVLKDWSFAEDVFGGPASMMGMDEIQNEGPGEVTQSISHSRSVAESYSIMSETSTTAAWEVHYDLSVGIPGFLGGGISGSYGESTTDTTGKIYTKETTREITSVRTITIPPFTTVQACSILQNVDNFTTTWNATAEFLSPGLSAAEVISEIKKDNSWKNKEFKEVGNAAFTRVSGTYSATMALSSQFYLGAGGCAAAQQFLSNNRNRRRGNSKDYDWRKEQADIRGIFKKARASVYGQ